MRTKGPKKNSYIYYKMAIRINHPFHEVNEKYLEKYDPNIDWSDLYLRKIYPVRSSRPDYFLASKDYFISRGYTEDDLNKIACSFYLSQVFAAEREAKAKQKVYDAVNPSADRKEWFVTLNWDFNDTKYSFTKEKFDRMIHILNEKKWYESYRGVFEIHRSDGIHPHFHMVLVTGTKLLRKKQQVIKYLHKATKEMMATDNYVDVKPWDTRHVAYIDGIKTDNKQEYLEKDEEYRTLNGYLAEYSN